jgi:endonuclease/exonuclease/phosphatase family metal-dependent hydrolase
LQNYYFNPNTGRGDYTQAEIAAKTRKIVNAMLDIDADIYAFCEVEAKPIVLQQLADSMNAHAGASGRYVPVSDNIDQDWAADKDYNIKSGFIYRTDKVATVGNNTGAVSGNGYYAHTMRLQAFRQLSDGEKLVVSMNHFKAKDSSEDAGEAQRQTNATNLLSALNKVNADPDILILGDLNCQVGETPITMIINAGYEEQLLKYNANAWSHCWGNGELIDHVFANASMAEQIVNAYVKHVSAYKCNSAVSSSQSWSDHDPYVVEINLSAPAIPETPCEDIDATYLTSSMEPMTSTNNIWHWDSNGYVKAQRSGGVTDYMFTPVLNMNGMSSASISFQHTHKFAGTPSEELTLWVTPDFQGDVESSTWQQLTISPYAANTNWTFVNVSIDVPVAYLGPNTVFAFKYMSTASNFAAWEIKNLHITAECAEGPGAKMENINEQKSAQKILRQGQIIIIRSGVAYTITGQRL